MIKKGKVSILFICCIGYYLLKPILEKRVMFVQFFQQFKALKLYYII